MRKFSIAIIFLLSFYNIFAQQTTAVSRQITQDVSGVVRDNITGEPLPGANIILLGSSPIIGTTTDIDGTFVLESVEVGFVSLKISFIGYKTVEIMNRELRTAKALNLKIFMDELVITGKEVIIKAGIDKRASINTMTTVSSRHFP